MRASDGGLHSDVTVTVNVTDVAEAPAFAEASYAFDLVENTDGGAASVALGAVSATDPENSTITYSIEAGDSGGLFEIDAASGEVFYIGAGEDYESGTTRYELTVRASDGSLHSDVTVAVNVTDVEEYVILAQEATETQQSVSEPDGQDLPDGVSTTGRVAVGGSATGKIHVFNDHDWFAVELEAGSTYRIDLEGSWTGGGTMRNPHLGSVRDADGVRILYTWDDDGGAGYNARVTFTATDAGTYYLVAGNSYVYTGGGEYDSKGTYTLSVTEVPDDLAPAFAEGSYAFSLAENADGGTSSVALGAVSATDPEDSTITYSIEAGDSGGLFEIDAASGEVFYIGVGEDYESGATRYELTVRASDGGLHSEVTVGRQRHRRGRSSGVRVGELCVRLGGERGTAARSV